MFAYECVTINKNKQIAACSLDGKVPNESKEFVRAAQAAVIAARLTELGYRRLNFAHEHMLFRLDRADWQQVEYSNKPTSGASLAIQQRCYLYFRSTDKIQASARIATLVPEHNGWVAMNDTVFSMEGLC